MKADQFLSLIPETARTLPDFFDDGYHVEFNGEWFHVKDSRSGIDSGKVTKVELSPLDIRRLQEKAKRNRGVRWTGD